MPWLTGYPREKVEWFPTIDEVFKDGILSIKTKELIAVAELVAAGKVRMMGLRIVKGDK